MADKIIDGVFWIGVSNPDSRSFHGIPSPKGGSYNSYLVLDEKPAIIDCTNKPFFQGWLESLSSLISPDKVAYIIVNHAENDHAGAIAQIVSACPNAKIVCTPRCKEFLEEAFGVKAEFILTKDGAELSLGSKKLKFFMDPMVHWPETQITYLEEDKVVFPADLFGTEIAHEHVFADEYEPYQKMTRDYFALIFQPYHVQVQRAVDIVKRLDVKLIAPAHGPVYRKDISKLIDYYDRLLNSPQEDKVLIVYYSIWHSTEKMAQKLAEGVRSEGFEPVIVDISKANMIELMAESLTSKAIALGSLTMINHFHPLFEALFKFLELNSQRGKKCVAFGTHGWAPMAVAGLKHKLEGIGYDVVDSVDLLFGMRSPEDETKLVELGRKLVKSTK